MVVRPNPAFVAAEAGRHTMHRFFVSPEVVATSSVTLTGDQAHQVRRVLRLQPGAEVALLDGSGWVYRCAVASVNTADVRLDVLDRTQGQGEPSVHIVLHQAVLKGDHFNWVLQKGVEVGVSAFVPTVCARSVVDDMQAIDARRGRWERIIREAAEQCGRPLLPELRPAQLLSQSLEAGEQSSALRLIPWEGEHVTRLGQVLAACNVAAGTCIELLVGPEGGFTEDEIERARRHGVQPVTLGSRVLRAETAGIVAATAILVHAGEL